jgi:Tfp pilus assembly PilM family ATPase
MPLLLAIDWDTREARIAAGTLRGKRLRIEHLFTVAWTGASTFDPQAAAARAAALQEALRKRGLGRGDAVVAIGRAAVELKQLALPPAPDEELPDLVRFLAQREFHALGPEGVVDFVPAPAAPGEARSVLAAMLDGAAMSHVTQVCEQAGLRLKRLVLRPAATASLALRRLPSDDVARLLVEPAADEAEVTALVGQQIVLLRSARMPGDTASPDYARALTGELRRTLAAVHHQWPERRVERIELCGDAADWSAAAAKLGEELSVAVDLVDPWQPLPDSLENVAPESHAHLRFAAVLGMAADEAQAIRPRFDFANPRRAAPPPNRRKQAVIGAFVATLLFASVWLLAQSKLNGLDDEFAAVGQASAALKLPVDRAAQIEKRAAVVDHWLKSDAVWLDEFERLSRLAPPAEVLQLKSLRFTTRQQTKSSGRTSETVPVPEMKLQGLAADPDAVATLERDLRDARHTVEGKGIEEAGSKTEKTSRYPWVFGCDVLLKPAAPASTGTLPTASGAKGGR